MKHALALLLAALLASSPLAQNSDGPQTRLATFDRVWSIIDQQHFDPNFNGVDWDAIKQELRPSAEAAGDMEEVRGIIREMLASLGQSHFALIEKESLAGGANSAAASPAGTVGFDVRIRDGVVLVFRVEPRGPAAAAGVQEGWILNSLDGVAVQEIVAEFPKSQTLRPPTAIRKRLLPKIDGVVGSKVRFRFEMGAGESTDTIELTRVERDAVPFDLPGLPTFYLSLRSNRFQHGDLTIGVVHFSNWFNPIASQIDEALIALRDCDGIILDLRANSGGDGTLAGRVAGHFFEKKSSLGTQVSRRREREYTIRPRRSQHGRKIETFTGPLAILSDETTGSCSEIFTGGLQALGRARVFGEQTAGAGLPATLTELPNQDFLLHAIGDFITARGTSLEGDGVWPDQVVPLARENLLAGRDATQEAAAHWIAGEHSKAR